MSLPILICDDSNLARKQMARSLPPGWDVEISFAKNGQEGVDLIRAGKGDVVFLDLNMPVMDGYEVLEEVQKNDLPALIIVVSGDVQPEAYNRVKQLGALDFIKKPTNKAKIGEILVAYGIVESQQLLELENDLAALDKMPAPANDTLSPKIVDFRDHYQEIANVAMGRAADLLARLLDTFIVLPIPNVNILETSELHMALSSVEENEEMSAVCQGFIGSGIAGEALLLFHDSSFADMSKLMKYKGEMDDNGQLEVLMDIANILIGACLKGVSDQLDVGFSQGHPVVLGQHCNIGDLISNNTHRWQKTLAIEINYTIEKHNIQCDLLLLITEDSLPTLNNKISYLFEHHEPTPK
ncbi:MULTISPECIES: response regulator [unclassified Agarivorans]|uniref:response regulator n=1 Tax=unclassified Agarivorans TaxID=2636026 RepID=UPI0010D5823E|nr:MULTISPECIES: response regulator [unclassified Agarivorans]MDO6763998.1 response regulator [Agarivorans sp. 1_MG-2023]GDY28073.1 response regulator [Agarivorans sp. Toyoura001]